LQNRHWQAQARAWRVPASYALVALAAGVLFPRLEARFVPQLVSDIDVAAGMAIYSAIASGMIALTGIVFSLTFVMVQFSATAYSPRLVLWLARDPLISHTLGAFIATFLYAIAAMAWVGRISRSVPFLSALAVVALLLASVALLIALIQRIGLLQINRMLGFTGDRGREVIDALYPPLDAPAAVWDGVQSSTGAQGPVQLVHHGRPMVVQAIDVDTLIPLAVRSHAVVEVIAAVGDTVVESTPLLNIHGAHVAIDDHAIREAVILGDERTFEQDPKFAVRILVDIAIKALSPAVNDPTTAVQALDQIGDLLLRLSRRRLEIGAYADAAGETRVMISFPSWEDFLRLAFNEIRCYGATSVQVMRRMQALVNDLLATVPPERQEPLRRWRERLAASIQRNFEDPHDRSEALAEDRQGLGASRRPRPVSIGRPAATLPESA
jgi:uncharacterized membrane protein